MRARRPKPERATGHLLKTDRIHTGLGLVYRTLRFFLGAKGANFFVRRPWHVADLYVAGRFQQAIYIRPRESAYERLKRLELEAENLKQFINRKNAESNSTRRA